MPNVPERRQFGRRHSRVHAWVRVPGRPAIACHVSNVSPAGAFLNFEPPGWMPFQFELSIPATGLHRTCELRHVRAYGVGVAFVTTPSEAATEAEPRLGLDPAVGEWVGARRG